MTKRAVLYARVSSDDRGKEGRNLKGQIEMGREYAEKRGYTIVAELEEDDRGASGAEINLPKLNRAREMAAADEFDVLVVREIDRLSRNLAKQLIVEQELQQDGVQIEYVIGEYPDTPEGRLNKHIKATISEYEREKIAERTTRARRRKVADGHVLAHGKPPYGYRLAEVGNKELVIHEQDKTQRRVKREKDDRLETGKRVLVVHEPEARTVRLIYRWYTVGDETGKKLSAKRIAARLTEMDVLTWADIHKPKMRKKGKRGQWYCSTVLKILCSETYMGKWHYGQRNNRTNENHPREHWITAKVPPLVSEETWNTARDQRKKNKTFAKRNTKHDYLLCRRVRCGKCTHSMRSFFKVSCGKHYKYYACNSADWHTANGRCGAPSFRADHVDATVWEWMSELFANPEIALRGLQEEQSAREEANKPLYDRLTVVDDLLADNRAQLARVLDLYLTEDFPCDMLTERKERLQKTIDALGQERVELVTELEAVSLTDEQIEGIMGFTTMVREGLDAAEGDFKKRRQLIEALDLWVTLAIEDGQRVIHVRCILGRETLLTENTTSKN